MGERSGLRTIDAPFAWGDLQHHRGGDCPCCEGNGFDDDGDGCTNCGERGELWWGSFYEQERGECERCRTDNVPIAAMYNDAYVCLPCWLRDHSRECGCLLWRAAEIAYGIDNSANTAAGEG